MYDFIKETFFRLIDELQIENQRYLYPDFHAKNRLTGLIGPRGVGKTTLILQYIKNALLPDGNVFYFSADLVYFQETTLLKFVSDLYHNEGYRIFFIDEIHKYQNWNQEIKNLYDAFPSIKIVYLGSSMQDHHLSRRAKLFHLHGMSFREYLNFVTTKTYEPISFPQILNAHRIGEVEKLGSHFQSYLEQGYYPFVFEDPHSYYERLGRIVDKTIYEDIANYHNLKTPHLHYFKKILSYLASTPPGEVNSNKLAQNMGIDHKTAFHYLTILRDVGLVRFLPTYQGGNAMLRKPQKIFLHNTTLLCALNQYISKPLSKGTLRELFFVQSLFDADIDLYYSKVGDFQTQDTIFEIGGNNKSRKQIQKAPLPAFLVKDDLLSPSKGQIPLHYFGFLY